MATDEQWKEEMRELREMTIAGDMPSIKRRVFDLILFGPGDYDGSRWLPNAGAGDDREGLPPEQPIS